jgi:CBS domain-containing protein
MQERSMGEMVRDQHPLTMGPDATVQEACAAMHRRRVGAVLVTDPAGRLLGIFTGRDAVHFLSHGRDSAEIRLAEAMTRHPICLPPEGNAMDALHMMADGGFRHLPVVRDGKVLGIVSRYDFRAKEYCQLDQETGFFECLR